MQQSVYSRVLNRTIVTRNGGVVSVITVKTEVNEEALAVLRKLALESPVNVKKRKAGRILLAVAAALLVFAAVVFLLNQSYATAIVCLIAAAFFAWVVVAGAQRYQDYLMKRVQDKQRPNQMPEQVEYTFDTDGVKVSSTLGHGSYTWDSFSAWGTIENFIYLKRNDGHALLVNKQALSSEEATVLSKFLNDRLTKEG